MIERVIAALSGARFSCTSEAELQAAVGKLLAQEGIGHAREVRLSARDRVDFMVDGGIALELKVKTTGTALMRQLLRYAEHKDVTSIVVGSTTHHALLLPETANGKPIHAVHLRGY